VGRAARDLGLVGVGKEGGDAALIGAIKILISEKLQAAAQNDAGPRRGEGKAGIANQPGLRRPAKQQGGGEGQRGPQPTTSAG